MAAGERPLSILTAKQALQKLMDGNAAFVSASQNDSDISTGQRQETATMGQFPYAVVLTCSDSRVPAEHIFMAGIGDLFVVSTAGNVVGAYEMGSVEYAVKHLSARAILILGHKQCGAVAAALQGYDEGHIKDIAEEIARGLPPGAQDQEEAERLNLKTSKARLLESDTIRNMQEIGEILIAEGIYDVQTGKVTLIDG